jgi:hypothetical protein
MSKHWKALRLVFRAESPIHIGWHDLGMIQRTRYYIPARAIWGAMVAGYAARHKNGKGVPEIYQNAQKDLESWFRSTCFFPKCGLDGNLMRPQFLNQKKSDGDRHGLYYGDLHPTEFEARWVFSQTSTAIEASCLAAEDQALHESEYLSPVARSEESDVPRTIAQRHLHFEGYVFFTSNLTEDDISSALGAISIGADRRYGWGRLKNVTQEASSDIFGFLLDDFHGYGPGLKPNGKLFHLPGHLNVENTEDCCLAGDLEVLSGRDWYVPCAQNLNDKQPRSGAGQQLTGANLCWVPGTRGSGDSDWSFVIEPQGTWKVTSLPQDALLSKRSQ